MVFVDCLVSMGTLVGNSPPISSAAPWGYMDGLVLFF